MILPTITRSAPAVFACTVRYRTEVLWVQYLCSPADVERQAGAVVAALQEGGGQGVPPRRHPGQRTLAGHQHLHTDSHCNVCYKLSGWLSGGPVACLALLSDCLPLLSPARLLSSILASVSVLAWPCSRAHCPGRIGNSCQWSETATRVSGTKEETEKEESLQ